MIMNTKEQLQKKESSFKLMLNTFEEMYDKKLEPSKVVLWKKFLLFDEDYPANYFVKVVELAGELKWFPTISEIKERFHEYELQDAGKHIALPEPRKNRDTELKWIRQIKTIISYGGLLREDFDDTQMGRLYEPEQLREILNSNLKPGAKLPRGRGIN